MNTGPESRRNKSVSGIKLVLGICIAMIALPLIVIALVQPPESEPDVSERAESTSVVREHIGAHTPQEIIDLLEKRPEDSRFAEAHEYATKFMGSGRLDDAEILFIFAARGGYAAAAFDLATLNDPNHFENASHLIPGPDPILAYRWYLTALDGGDARAVGRLEALHAWARAASERGDSDAIRLMSQWEHR